MGIKKAFRSKLLIGFLILGVIFSINAQKYGSNIKQKNTLILQMQGKKLLVISTNDSSIIAKAYNSHALYIGPNLSLNLEVKKNSFPSVNIYSGTKGNYWGYQLDTLGMEKAWAQSTGAGVKVAVIDTGVDPNEISLKDRVLPGWAPDGSDGRVDANGHGTAVATLIAGKLSDGNGVIGVAPDSLIVPIAAVGESGIVSSDVVIKGIIWAVQAKVDIINISMSGTEDYPPLQAAIDYAVSNNILVVTSAGNFYQTGNPKTYPASYSGVLAVGAVDKDNQVASYSTQGSFVSLVAPGVEILAPWVGRGVSSWEGTSVSAPLVAGLAALLKSKYNELDGYQLNQALTHTAKDLSVPGFDNATGYGIPDINSALSYISSNYFTAELGQVKIPYGVKTITLKVKGAGNEKYTNPIEVSLEKLNNPNLVSREYASISPVSGYNIKIDNNTTSVTILSYAKELASNKIQLTRYVKPLYSIKHDNKFNFLSLWNLCEGCKITFYNEGNKMVRSLTLGKSSYTFKSSILGIKSVRFTIAPPLNSNGLSYKSSTIKLEK